MKRILFVDDERLLLDGLQALLRRYRGLWHMEFVISADAALARLAASPFDLVVTDLKMPGMDGATLLERVRVEYPSCLRLLLSGHADSIGGLRKLPAAQRILSKPCDGPTLIDVLSRSCLLHDLLYTEPLVAVTGGAQPWPEVPVLYSELTRLWAEPVVNLPEMARRLELDPTLCEAVLQAARSAALTTGLEIGTATEALMQLGADVVRHLVLWVVAAQSFAAAGVPRAAIERVEAHSLRVARAARRVAADSPSFELVMAAALLHDVGELLLHARRPDELRLCDERVRDCGEERDVAERAVLGWTHAEAGASLLCRWGLPQEVVLAVAFHHANHIDPSQTVTAVQLADQLANAAEARAHGESVSESLLVASRLREWRDGLGGEEAAYPGGA